MIKKKHTLYYMVESFLYNSDFFVNYDDGGFFLPISEDDDLIKIDLDENDVKILEYK